MIDMIGPFRVGDSPADPLDLTVVRPNDTTPTSGFTAATIELYRANGTSTTWTGTINGAVVRSTFPAGSFTVPGQYKIRMALTGAGGVVERTSWAFFWVRP